MFTNNKATTFAIYLPAHIIAMWKYTGLARGN